MNSVSRVSETNAGIIEKVARTSYLLTESRDNGSLPAVADCLTVTLVDRFDGALSPVEQSADSRTGRLANGSRLRGRVLGHRGLLGFVTGHSYVLYQGARRRSRRARFSCRV